MGYKKLSSKYKEKKEIVRSLLGDDSLEGNFCIYAISVTLSTEREG